MGFRPLSILLLILFFHAYFFYESQALHRQLCSGICYFLVTLLFLHMLFFGVFASNYALFSCVCVCACVLFFFVFFFFLFNFELCACLLYAV